MSHFGEFHSYIYIIFPLVLFSSELWSSSPLYFDSFVPCIYHELPHNPHWISSFFNFFWEECGTVWHSWFHVIFSYAGLFSPLLPTQGHRHLFISHAHWKSPMCLKARKIEPLFPRISQSSWEKLYQQKKQEFWLKGRETGHLDPGQVRAKLWKAWWFHPPKRPEKGVQNWRWEGGGDKF